VSIDWRAIAVYLYGRGADRKDKARRDKGENPSTALRMGPTYLTLVSNSAGLGLASGLLSQIPGASRAPFNTSFPIHHQQPPPHTHHAPQTHPPPQHLPHRLRSAPHIPRPPPSNLHLKSHQTQAPRLESPRIRQTHRILQTHHIRQTHQPLQTSLIPPYQDPSSWQGLHRKRHPPRLHPPHDLPPPSALRPRRRPYPTEQEAETRSAELSPADF